MLKLKSPILLIFIAAICFSFPTILIKLIIDTISPTAILFLRYIFVVITFPLILITIKKSSLKELFTITKLELKYFFFLSLFIILDQIFYFQSLYYISASKALFLFLTFPVMTLFLARIFLKEKITITDTTATIISLVGIIIMFWIKVEFTLNSFKGELLVLLSALLWAGYIILNRHSGQTENFYKKTNWIFLINVAILLIIISFSKTKIPIYSLNLFEVTSILFIAIVSTLISFTLLNYALKYVKSSTSSMILLLAPIIGIFLSFIVLKEKPPINVLIGGFLILTSAFISTYSIEKVFQTSKLFSNKIKTILFGY